MRTSARAVVVKGKQLLVMDRNKFGDLYIAIPGGGLEIGEKPEEAAIRELREETGVTVANPKLIIVEDAGEIFGIQYIYKCDYVSGEPKLDPESIESKINAEGKNLYSPKWLNIDEIAASNMLPHELRDLLVKFFSDGFPDQPVELHIAKDSKL